MSSGLSSDQIIKYEIMEKVTVHRDDGIVTRIFPEGSNQDQRLIADGGLTFSYNGVDYGSCDAGWFFKSTKNGKTEYEPIIALEGTDALNRGSSGDAQYQRFHHALGAVKNGQIGIYYLREGKCPLQLDLYEMAYNATIHEDGEGAYLIIQDLKVVNDLLDLICKYGRYSNEVKKYLNDYAEWMHNVWKTKKFSSYTFDWATYAKKRSTIMGTDYIIKYNGRMKRNYTDGSQRAGHIAVGEMFLSKYLFYGKKVYYLSPRMSQADVDELDCTKKEDKEWALLRCEENVYYKTRDDIIGLPSEINEKLQSITTEPLKNGTPAMATYKECLKEIVAGLENGKYSLRK